MSDLSTPTAGSSLTNAILIGKTIITLIPYVIEAIKAAEVLFTDSTGKGPEKLEFVKTLLQVVYEQIDQIWNPMQKIIATIVAIYNKTGVFQTKA